MCWQYVYAWTAGGRIGAAYRLRWCPAYRRVWTAGIRTADPASANVLSANYYVLPEQNLGNYRRIRRLYDDRITAVLRELHWLPVLRRVEFKIATLVFKARNGLAPPYLVDDCNLVSDDIRRLRSAVSFTCAVPRTRTSFGDRSFAVAGPRVCNCLPAALWAVEDYEQFKKLLKHICSIRLRRLVTFCF